MHVRQSYSVSLCTCFGAKTLHNINNLGLCIMVHVFFILFQYGLIWATARENLYSGCKTRSDTKWAIQPYKLYSLRLKFGIK